MPSNPTMTLAELVSALEAAQQERMPWTPETAQSYADLMERAAKVLRAVEKLREAASNNAKYPKTGISWDGFVAYLDVEVTRALGGSDERQ